MLDIREHGISCFWTECKSGKNLNTETITAP